MLISNWEKSCKSLILLNKNFGKNEYIIAKLGLPQYCNHGDSNVITLVWI